MALNTPQPEILSRLSREQLEAIAVQESAGLDVITDGELRRHSWVVTIPLREEGAPHAPLAGYEFLPADPGWWSLWKEPDGRRAQAWTAPTRPFVTRPLSVARDIVASEYAFLPTRRRTAAASTRRRNLTTRAPGGKSASAQFRSSSMHRIRLDKRALRYSASFRAT